MEYLYGTMIVCIFIYGMAGSIALKTAFRRIEYLENLDKKIDSISEEWYQIKFKLWPYEHPSCVPFRQKEEETAPQAIDREWAERKQKEWELTIKKIDWEVIKTTDECPFKEHMKVMYLVKWQEPWTEEWKAE